MSKRFFIILFLIPIFCFSQDSTGSKSKYSIGLYFAPCYSYRILSYDPEQVEIYNERNKRDKPAFGYSAGIVIQKRMHKKLNMSYSIMFTQYSFFMKKSLLNYGSEIDYLYGIGNGHGFLLPLNPTDSTMPVYYSKTNNYFYLRVPVSLNYNFKIRQRYLSTSISFMPIDIFLDNKNYFTFYYKDNSQFEVIDPSLFTSVRAQRIFDFSFAFSFAYITQVFHSKKLSISLFFNEQLLPYSGRSHFFQIGLSNCIII